MSTITKTEKPVPAPAPSDPFNYGWRDIYTTQPDGSSIRTRQPLTLRDHLHPQEGDCFIQGSLHNAIRGYLNGVCRVQLRGDASVLVLSNTGVYWDIPELEHHSPDVAVIFGVRKQRQDWPSFQVAEEGVRPRIIIEIVSVRYRVNEVTTKFHEYHLGRVPVYVILDHERDVEPWVLRGYQWEPNGYAPITLNDKGWLWLEDLNIWLTVDGLRVCCIDGDTNEEIEDYVAISNRVNEMTKRVNELETRREAAEIRLRESEAEIARLKGQLPQ